MSHDDDAENSAYERAWQIELKVEELFRRDDPTGSFVRRLPQFRSSCPDPVGDGILRVPPGAPISDLGPLRALVDIGGARSGRG